MTDIYIVCIVSVVHCALGRRRPNWISTRIYRFDCIKMVIIVMTVIRLHIILILCVYYFILIS